jgi:hypothetical protein
MAKFGLTGIRPQLMFIPFPRSAMVFLALMMVNKGLRLFA